MIQKLIPASVLNNPYGTPETEILQTLSRKVPVGSSDPITNLIDI